MNLQELSSAYGTDTKEEAQAKGEKLREAIKFGKWEVRTWGRWVNAKQYWHYELKLVDTPLLLSIGASQGRSDALDCFYVTIKVPALDVMIGYDKEYLDPFDAVLAAYREYAAKIAEHTAIEDAIERGIFGVRTI